MDNLLYDDEVCKVINCELGISLQPIPRQRSDAKNYEEYALKFKNYIHEFLYGDKSAAEVLNKINDITKIYHISLDSSTKSGIIIFIITIILSVIIVSSFSLLFIKGSRNILIS